MKRPSRRTVVLLAGAGAAGLVTARLFLPRWLRPGPVVPVRELSGEARALVELAFEGLDPRLVWDLHAHLAGLGTSGSATWVNPDMRSHLNPLRRLQYDAYVAASGVDDPERADAQYLARLLRLHRAYARGGRLVLLAFDWHVAEGGEVLEGATPFHVPNPSVLDVAEQNLDVEAGVSIHPYRRDAVARLEDCVERGAVLVKWLPNAQGIDPASPLCDAFYAKLAELDVPLLCHTGEELAVAADGSQELGNPLRLRRALDAGVRVLAAHCAGLGEALDLDAPEAERGEMEAFDLFLRLMAESQWEGRLFGEISALTVANRSGRPLRELLLADELHPRLVNGSDYPVTAVDPLVSARLLAWKGYLEPDEVPLLEEIEAANPLLHDFVLKRRLAAEDERGRRRRFAPVVFESGRLFA